MSASINELVTPVTNYKHKRVVAVELKQVSGHILFICAYMPFYNASRREHCITETIDAISMIELLIEEHPNHHVIIGGDLNTELNGDSPFDRFWLNLITKNSFVYCDNQFLGPQYTYRHETLNQSKFNDHFLISHSLANATHNHKIIDDGENTSDHLPLVMDISIQTGISTANENTSTHATKKPWRDLSEDELNAYSSAVELRLLSRTTTLGVFACSDACACSSQSCRDELQREYDDIVKALVESTLLLPNSVNRGAKKDWWTHELTLLKEKSVAIHSAWISEGRPRHGSTADERRRVRAEYKSAIRNAKRAPKQKAWDRIHSDFIDNDTVSFWKRWRSLHGKKNSDFAPVVDGQSSKENIANAFRTAFEKNSTPNNVSKVDELNSRFTDEYNRFKRNHALNCDCGRYNLSVEDTFDAICSMKDGKSPDDDGISAENFKNGPLVLFIKLTSLFNAMLSHGFVPHQFRYGTITPIIKDKNGNHSDTNNYRGITISPLISKVFERTLKSLFSQFLTSSPYQFGFKSNRSTSHALFCLKETINYYIDHGSKVYCSFLDASKAFDRLIHSGLFLKLIQRETPRVFLDILVTWYQGLHCRIKWDGHLGDWFPISAGVRQGGILSPQFYNIYVDDLIHLLQQSGIGCHISDIFAASLFYADDMCVMAPSLRGLQKLLDLCSKYCAEWDICLNAKKTKNMVFGKKAKTNVVLSLNGIPIEWVTEWRYLGVILVAGAKYGCSVKDRVKSFYRSLNAILRIEGRSNDLILLQLIEAHCVPILSYAIEVTDVSNRDERRSMRVAYNSVFRKIFGYRTFESVTNLQHSLYRCTWEELLEKRQSGFLRRARMCRHDSLVRAFC